MLFLCAIAAGNTALAAATKNETPPPTSEQQFEKACRDLEILEKDAKRREWRDPWEKLARTFLLLYENHQTWRNRPAALLRSAYAMEQLGAKSHRPGDSREAISRYERLARENPKSPLADDALYKAARLRADRFSDTKGALLLLRRINSHYKNSDFAGPALAWMQELTGFGNAGRTDVRLESVKWEDRGGLANLVLEFDGPVSWKVTSFPRDKKIGRPDRLVLDLHNTVPDTSIRPSTVKSSSILRRIRLDHTVKDTTRLYLDFTNLKRFTVTGENNPFRLIVKGSATDKGLPRGTAIGKSAASGARAWWGYTVVLDPGHGGKDRGVCANNLTESEVTLEMARLVGSFLEQKGIRVLYTRTDDVWMSQEARAHTANVNDAELFVSLHVNAGAGSSSGFETYVPGMADSQEAAALAARENESEQAVSLPTGEQQAAKSRRTTVLAGAIQKKVVENLQNFETRDGGVHSAPIHVLVSTGMPAVLLEMGHGTNSKDAQNLLSPDYRKALAQSIATALVDSIQTLEDLEWE